MAVPLFFFISGYLFFLQKDFNAVIYKKKIHSRIKTLLVPYFLWNLIAITWQAVRLIPVFSSLFPGSYKTEIHISLIRVFNTFFNNTLQNGIFVSPIEYNMAEKINEPYPIDVPLWYVRELMVMVIISPLIYWIIKKCNNRYILFLGGIWCIKTIFFCHGGYITMLITALFFFSWGGFYGINGINFVKEMQKFSLFSLLYLPMAIMDTLTINTHYNSFIHSVGIIIGIITIIYIAAKLMEREKIHINSLMVKCTFFVYALHKLIINDVAKIVFSALHLPDNTFVMLTFYIVIPIVTIAICVMLYTILNRKLPVICNILTGGR